MFVLHSLMVIVLTTLCFWCYEIYRKNKMLDKIPGPLPLPFIGIKLPTNIYDVTDMFKNLFEKYGKIVKLYIGGSLYVAVCDSELIKEIMESNVHIHKSKLYDLSRPFLKDGLITSFGSKWKQRRKYLTPSFHFGMLKDFFPIFKEKSKILIKKLGEEADKGVVINAIDFVSKFALDVITESSFGVTLNVQEGSATGRKYIEAVNRFTEIVFIRNFSIWKRSDLLFKLLATEYKEFQTALETLNNTAKEIIAQKRQEFKHHYEKNSEIDEKQKVILINALMQHSNLNDEDIHEEVNNFIFAGYDTTSACVSFALYELSKRPDIQQKLYEEINSFIHNDSEILSQGNIQEMKYLDQVLKEVLRLRTPVPIIERELFKDARFGDTLFPKGTTINISLFWTHHQKDYYPDPEKFNPERFNTENIRKYPTFGFVPFSAGARNCIGQRYALLEMKTALTNIIMEFKILPVEGVDLILGMTALLRSKHGFPIKLERREKN